MPMRVVSVAAVLTLLAATLSWPTDPSAGDGSLTAGDDFFAYANRGWLAATALPAG